MTSPYSFTRPGQVCAGDVCMDMRIVRNDGTDEPAVCDTPVTPWHFKVKDHVNENVHTL